MKKLGLIVPTAAVAAALLIPALGAAQVAAPSFAPKNCSKPKVAPARLTISCGDGNFYVRSIKWDEFGSERATGRGRAYINDCRRNCAAGSFDSYKVDLLLKRVSTQKCGGKTLPMFTKIAITYPGKAPKGSKGTDTYPLFCIP